MTCAFFGHSLCPDSVKSRLKLQIENLIITYNIKSFLLGDHGEFDVLVLKTIRELVEKYDISYKVVLSYMPRSSNFFAADPHSVYPEELAFVPKKFAIEYRNRYLIENSDFFITYITHNYGGAAKFAKMAKNKGKTVINISENNKTIEL